MEVLDSSAAVDGDDDEADKEEEEERYKSKYFRNMRHGRSRDDENNNINNHPPFTLARLDITEDNGRNIEAFAFIPSCLNIRVVPTDEAPTSANIPPKYIERGQHGRPRQCLDHLPSSNIWNVTEDRRRRVLWSSVQMKVNVGFGETLSSPVWDGSC